MAEIIDAYGHFVLEDLHEELMSVHPSPYTADTYLSARDKPVEEYIADMDEFGIDRQIITQQPARVWKGLDPEEALPLTRLANDEIRRVADSHPDRFIPVGTVPFMTGEYIDEFERCIDELNMAGVQVFTNIGDRPIDSEECFPFYEAVERKDVPIWLHPQDAAWDDWDNINDFSLSLIYGWPTETASAMTRLVLSGVMRRFPDLKIISHHMGGPVAHFENRISTFYTWRDEQDKDYDSANIGEDLRKFYPDTARQGSPAILEDGHEFFGNEKMVFGTDYPFGPNGGRAFVRAERDAVEEMAIEPQEREQVFAGNIKRIANIE